MHSLPNVASGINIIHPGDARIAVLHSRSEKKTHIFYHDYNQETDLFVKDGYITTAQKRQRAQCRFMLPSE